MQHVLQAFTTKMENDVRETRYKTKKVTENDNGDEEWFLDAYVSIAFKFERLWKWRSERGSKNVAEYALSEQLSDNLCTVNISSLQ